MAEIESMGAPTKTGLERGARTVLTKDVNGSKDGEDADESKLGKACVGAKVCGHEDCVGGVVAVIEAYPSEIYAVESAVEIVL